MSVTLRLAPSCDGWGREATTAHPDCTCTTLASCTVPSHPAALMLGDALCRDCRSTCPMHGPTR